MKATFALLLLLCAGLGIWGAGERGRGSDLEASLVRQAEAMGYTADSLKNELAKAIIAKERVQDTVEKRVVVYRTLRDSLEVLKHDTTYVERVVEAADSTIAACQQYVASCDELQAKAQLTIQSLKLEVEQWKRIHENEQHHWCGRKCGIAIGVVATVVAARWVGEVQETMRGKP